ncbi:unnamed protein product [Prorocentrum cordatum]|uniref:Uncharacterized protein n=1 Tax=Prorocentrum cordatum TaxID=2364126 RepID=A0ABN9X007_9DINO|nr:unnamed protein product [Polarella glacialis]
MRAAGELAAAGVGHVPAGPGRPRLVPEQVPAGLAARPRPRPGPGARGGRLAGRPRRDARRRGAGTELRLLQADGEGPGLPRQQRGGSSNERLAQLQGQAGNLARAAADARGPGALEPQVLSRCDELRDHLSTLEAGMTSMAERLRFQEQQVAQLSSRLPELVGTGPPRRDEVLEALSGSVERLSRRLAEQRVVEPAGLGPALAAEHAAAADLAPAQELQQLRASLLRIERRCSELQARVDAQAEAVRRSALAFAAGVGATPWAGPESAEPPLVPAATSAAGPWARGVVLPPPAPAAAAEQAPSEPAVGSLQLEPPGACTPGGEPDPLRRLSEPCGVGGSSGGGLGGGCEGGGCGSGGGSFGDGSGSLGSARARSLAGSGGIGGRLGLAGLGESLGLGGRRLFGAGAGGHGFGGGGLGFGGSLGGSTGASADAWAADAPGSGGSCAASPRGGLGDWGEPRPAWPEWRLGGRS